MQLGVDTVLGTAQDNQDNLEKQKMALIETLSSYPCIRLFHLKVNARRCSQEHPLLLFLNI